MVIIRDPKVELEQINFQYLNLNLAEYPLLIQAIEDRLRSNWSYVNTCLSSIESQLRFGCALSNRRSTPTSMVSGTSTSTNNSSSVNSTSANSSIPNYSNDHRSRGYARLRTFQSQDELAILPTFRGNFRRSNPTTASNRSSSNNNNSNTTSNNNTSNNGNSTNSSSYSESSQAGHRDFLSYTMSLMRAHSNEHYDSLPVLDVSSQKHIAYIFDALMYFMRRGLNEMIRSDKFDPNNLGKKHSFFRRTRSTLYLGCPRPDPFLVPYHEALPLANKPQLLTPSARKEQMFGIPRPSTLEEAESWFDSLPMQMGLIKKHPWSVNRSTTPSTSHAHSLLTPIRNHSVITESRASITPNKLSVIVMAGSARQQSSFNNSHISEHNYVRPSHKSLISSTQKYFGNMSLHYQFLSKWRLTLELFGRLFIDDVAIEPLSIIPDLTDFPIKESKFRREMERLRITCSTALQRDLNFYKLERDRNLLLVHTFKELNSAFISLTRRLGSQISLISQPMTITRVKVIFKDEPGMILICQRN